jgi:hypothetical protein
MYAQGRDWVRALTIESGNIKIKKVISLPLLLLISFPRHLRSHTAQPYSKGSECSSPSMPPIRSTTTPGPGELEPKQSPPSSPINQHSNDNDANSSNDEPFSPQLRDYQQKAVDAFMEGRERGLTRIGLSAPTGAGIQGRRRLWWSTVRSWLNRRMRRSSTCLKKGFR